MNKFEPLNGMILHFYLHFLQHKQVPTVDNLQKFYGLARLHRTIDGALYRIFRIRQSSHNQQFFASSSSSERLLLVIPASEVQGILQLAHDHATVAHLGRYLD